MLLMFKICKGKLMKKIEHLQQNYEVENLNKNQFGGCVDGWMMDG